ncbi:MAG: family transporter protein [Verrucomicrobiales bacterium]|nr:family transporter protein [Verrucomicrobiales bacterium]
MDAIRVLVFKCFARFLRNKSAVALTFIVPIAMIYIFGEVFGIRRGASGPSGIPLAVVSESSNPATQKLIDALKGERAFRVITTFNNLDKTKRPLVETDLKPLIESGAFRFAVVLPKRNESNGSFGVHLKVFSNPLNEIEAQTVTGLLQKSIFSHVPELLGQSLQANAKQLLGEQRIEAFNERIAGAIAVAFGGDKAQIRDAITNGNFGFSNLATNTASDFFSRIISIETVQVVARNVKNPGATRVVGGWAIMFLMFALNSTASSLFEEKKSGMLQRLLAAPVTRADILWSRFIFGVILGLVQLVAVFSVGSLLYGIDVLGHWGNLVVVCVAAAAACTAFGMLIASISPSPEVAQGLATFLILTMSACGGAWFPISFMPEFMQQLARFTLTYWAMDGFAQVLWAGNSFPQILPTISVLFAITAGVMAIAIWRFNRGRLFD